MNKKEHQNEPHYEGLKKQSTSLLESCQNFLRSALKQRPRDHVSVKVRHIEVPSWYQIGSLETEGEKKKKDMGKEGQTSKQPQDMKNSQ
jgi:hypothetical protein